MFFLEKFYESKLKTAIEEILTYMNKKLSLQAENLKKMENEVDWSRKDFLSRNEEQEKIFIRKFENIDSTINEKIAEVHKKFSDSVDVLQHDISLARQELDVLIRIVANMKAPENMDSGRDVFLEDISKRIAKLETRDNDNE